MHSSSLGRENEKLAGEASIYTLLEGAWPVDLSNALPCNAIGLMLT